MFRLSCCGQPIAIDHDAQAIAVPAHAEGYLLQVTPEGATVVGADDRGLYYGVQTLLQMMAEGKLEVCQITDWPDVAEPGVGA